MYPGTVRLVRENPHRQARLMELFSLHFIERHENVIFCGPVGVGKSYWAQSLGHAACRAGYRVLFIRSDGLLKNLARSRADNSFDRELRSFYQPGSTHRR